MSVTDFIKAHKVSLGLYSLNLGTSVVEIASGHPEMVEMTAPVMGLSTAGTFLVEKLHAHDIAKKKAEEKARKAGI
jgi:hypothetical protein